MQFRSTVKPPHTCLPAQQCPAIVADSNLVKPAYHAVVGSGDVGTRILMTRPNFNDKTQCQLTRPPSARDPGCRSPLANSVPPLASLRVSPEDRPSLPVSRTSLWTGLAGSTSARAAFSCRGSDSAATGSDLLARAAAAKRATREFKHNTNTTHKRLPIAPIARAAAAKEFVTELPIRGPGGTA